MKPGNTQPCHPTGARGFDTRWRILHHETVPRRGWQIRSGQEEDFRVWLALLQILAADIRPKDLEKGMVRVQLNTLHHCIGVL